jgi:hypothetical protein
LYRFRQIEKVGRTKSKEFRDSGIEAIAPLNATAGREINHGYNSAFLAPPGSSMSLANLVVERGVVPMPQTEEIAWRHVWLKSVIGRLVPTKIRRPTPRRMSLSQRLEKLHRMGATKAK